MSQSGVTGCLREVMAGGDGGELRRLDGDTGGKLLLSKGHEDLDLCLDRLATKGTELLQRPRQVT